MLLYFHEYKIAINANEERGEQELGCEAIRTDPEKEDLDIHKSINEIWNFQLIGDILF